MQSMTGYGSGLASSELGTLSVDIRSVNSRFLEINMRDSGIPAAASEKVRAIIRDSVERGKVSVTISFTESADRKADVEINRELLSAYSRAFDEARHMHGISKDKPSAGELLNVPEPWLHVTMEEIPEEEMVNIAREAASKAVNDLIAMRKREGENLVRDLLKRCELLEEKRQFIISRKDNATHEYETRLRDRMKNLLSELGTEADESKILMEVAAFSEKSDITEELVRFGSHIKQFEKILSEEGPAGKKLNFLLQEINREVNTTASKASELDIINCVIIIKTELEKIREQVQNLE